jgi:hypothetical protein
MDGLAQPSKFQIRRNRVHVFAPARWSWNWPVVRINVPSVRQAGCAAPLPIFRSRHESRSHGILLNVPAYRQKVSVVFDGDRLEATLVESARTGRVVGKMPAS